MKKLSLFLILFSALFSAQSSRMIYQYTFRPDSTKVDSLKTEWMYLDIQKDGSKYYSKNTFESDSIIHESIKKQMAAGMKNISVSRQNKGGEINYEVEKTYPEYKTYLTSRIGNDSYKVLEDRKIDWKITPEKKKIGEFNAQKATVNFAGRNWTAWFTNEVPVLDGPYKFSGLPGLIVEVYDDSGSHKMELKGIKKLVAQKAEELNTQGKDIPFLKKKPLEVNRQQYIKQLKQYQNDPVQGMREIMNQPNSKIKVNINGQEFTDPKEVLRALEQNAREEMKKNNNWIELKP